MITGRVTFAHSGDAMVESRSKANAADYERHQSSGMPKRMSPRSAYLNGLLFNESDCKEKGVGECIIDNWSIEAIVHNESYIATDPEMVEELVDIAVEYGVDLVTTDSLI